MKTSRVKFPRRVRIHGGECGAVARALHHAAQKEALMPYEQISNSLISDECVLLSQADQEKASRSTFNERKQMSTKTTLKRIALVAVSALGFGLVTSVSPASALPSGSATAGASSYTFVGAANGIGLIPISVADTAGTAQALENNETITVTVTGVPTTVTSTKTVPANSVDLELGSVTRSAAGVFTAYAGAGQVRTAGNSNGSAIESLAITNADSNGAGTVGNAEATSGAGTLKSVYWISVKGLAAAIDQGTYTLRIRLQNSEGLFSQSSVSVRFVSSPADSGAKITISASGTMRTNSTLTYARGSLFSAKLTDANDGRLTLAAASLPTTLSAIAPSLNASVVDKDGAALTVAQALTATDDGVAGSDSVTTSDREAGFNGTYGLTGTILSTTAASTTNLIRVWYGATSVTSALTIVNAAESTAFTGPFVTATGQAVIEPVADTWTLPLTATSVKVSVGGVTPGNAVSFLTTWTANTSSGNVTPTSLSTTIANADATGFASITLTNSAPVDGAQATVAIAGSAVATDTQTINWVASKPTAAFSSVDIDGAVVALGSTNTATVTVLDQFGAPMSGIVLRPSWTGANASTTRTYAAVTTNAQGQASYTFTDALAVAKDTDKITFTGVAATPAFSVEGVVTYAAAAPAVTAITTFYNQQSTLTTPTNTNVVTAVPTTGIYVDGVSKAFDVTIARNYSKVISLNFTAAAGSTPASSDGVVLRARVGAVGAKVTVTTSAGAFLLSGANTATASRTLYSDTNGDVFVRAFTTKAGANTVTFTSGTVTANAAFWASSADANARFVTLTGPATGAANGDLLSYTVSVTDRFGNPMKNQTVSVLASGVAVLGGGGTIASYTTDATGTFNFTGTSLNAAGGAGTYKVSVPTSNEFASIAGYSGTTAIDSTVAAGSNTASVSVTFAAGTSAAQAAAEAASDAAAEAIDAANAATDAANLAAEAADAATVAAEEARDAADAATAAVEELATQVATLMAALKAQITTLANTVAKIAKKVRA